MKLTRLRIGQEASVRLSQLKGRTGLTPNILCRIAFTLSLGDPTVPNPYDYPVDSDREIDRHTLTGSWDALFVAMIKERCQQDGLSLDDDTLAVQFRAHINRGVLLLHKRVKTLNDLAELLPRESRSARYKHAISGIEANDDLSRP